MTLCMAAATSIAHAADMTTITACPSQPTIPVKSTVDCTHVKDAATLQPCGAFTANQACKVFPAYRNITGIKAEERCPMIPYTIYDKDKFPHAGAGGLSYTIAKSSIWRSTQFCNLRIRRSDPTRFTRCFITFR